MEKVLFNDRGIFKRVVIKQELTNLTTGKSVPHNVPKDTVVKIEKESLDVGCGTN